MIYFDNSATGGFKPSAVYLSAENTIKYLNVNPGRSGHRLSVLGEEFVYRTRNFMSKSLNNGRIDRVIFTKNCTEALNTAIFGTVPSGGEVVSTITEHNSVLRPLYALIKSRGISVKFATPSIGSKIHAQDVLKLVSKNTSLVVMNAVSNVTGEKNDYEEVGEKLSCPLLVDMAQAGGHIEIDMKRDNVNIVALAGHKGLNSIQGVGVLAFDESVEIAPLTFGGSGTESFDEVPSCYPELLESGTLNLPAICSLYDGANYAFSNITLSKKRLVSNTSFIIYELEKLGAKVYSRPNPSGIVAFSLENYGSIELSEILSDKFDIAVRGGFHCAPLLHKFLKTDKSGLTRISLAMQNTESEIEKLIYAIAQIAKGQI